MAIVRDVYLSEFKLMPYKERIYYLLSNEVAISTPDMGSNPLYWCLIDLVNIIKFAFTVVILPFILILAMNEARLLKVRYEKEDKCSFFRNRRVIK